MNIDKRKKYILTVDTETCNSLEEPLVYDIGWGVCDKYGNIYKRKSYIVAEIFFGEKDLMTSAYYAEKIPMYLEDIKNGTRKVASFYEIKAELFADMEEYGIEVVAAYNARFDVKALNFTNLWVDNKKYFFPYGQQIWCILKMATDTICKQKMYDHFCKSNGYLTAHRVPQNRRTAEVVYRYLNNDLDFIESHTALEDVEIEAEIMANCFKQHKKMRKNLW